MGIQGVTRGYRGLEEVKKSFKGLQAVTRGYRVFYEVKTGDRG